MSGRTQLAIGVIAACGAIALWILPMLPRIEPFAIFPWVALFGYVAVVIIAITATLRRSAQWIAPCLGLLISIATAMFYLPLWFIRRPGIDRLRGEIERPVRTLQAIVTVAIVTLVLGVLLVAITRLRHAPGIARRTALVTVMIVNAGLLHLFWFVVITPFDDGWLPFDRDRPDLLIRVRPCRGAVVWAFTGRHYDDIGTIDDVWLRFADPRNGYAPTFAVSAVGRWRLEYFWLNSSDLEWMRVRKDDPALTDCDSRSRPERVTPAAWHKLGFEP
jgi:hypothetical protein